MNNKRSILHIVNQSPFEKQCLKQCLEVATTNDAILLLENGVYAALLNQPAAMHLKEKKCYAIKADLKARGLLNKELISSIELIDYNDFVQLCTEYDMTQSWY